MRSNNFESCAKYMTCFFFMLWISFASAAREKICDSEQAVFQCEVLGGKNIALCPIYISGDLIGVQYRFGREGQNELVYPVSDFDFKKYQSNHFVRYLTDYKRIKFFIGAYTYSLYSNYDGEKGESMAREAGVTVSNSSGIPDVQIPCTEIYSNNLEGIISRMECDTYDALGCR